MHLSDNLQAISLELEWFSQVLDQSIRSYFKQEGFEKSWMDIPMPDLTEQNSAYATSVVDWELNQVERLTLILGITPHISPETLDVFFSKNAALDRGYTEFGGIIDPNHSGFLPTWQTLKFIVDSDEIEKTAFIIELRQVGHLFQSEAILTDFPLAGDVPRHNELLLVSERWMHYFVNGAELVEEQTASFPAQEISTNLEWEDLIVPERVEDQLNEIKTWMDHSDELMDDWGLGKHLKPGYRTLFYGPPGTGKTLTASLLGKSSDRKVYRVDLSMVVSKYIGETEKNLGRIFDLAKNRNWILFFDEADSLFGKRTEASSSNDRHANQQTGYLLQKIEDFPGVVILASNLRANIDDAFSRRFQSMINFSMPDKAEREVLWRNAFSGSCQLDAAIDLAEVADKYELAGGAMINVLRYCAIAAKQKDTMTVSHADLMTGIRREYAKDNKTI